MGGVNEGPLELIFGGTLDKKIANHWYIVCLMAAHSFLCLQTLTYIYSKTNKLINADNEYQGKKGARVQASAPTYWIKSLKANTNQKQNLHKLALSSCAVQSVSANMNIFFSQSQTL